MTSIFPNWSEISEPLTVELITTALLKFKKQGYSIVFGKPPIIDGWTILSGDPIRWVAVRPGDTKNTWSICTGNLGRSVGQASSSQDLLGYLDAAMRMQMMSSKSSPTQVKLESAEPISNLSKIMSIVGNSSVESIWDAYLSNRMIETLSDLVSLGMKISPSIRILSSKNEARVKIKKQQLTESFFSHFKKSISSGAQVRLCIKEHDRFIILDDGRCLSPDFSLNQVENRGTINTISDAASRIKWFEQEWSSSSLWPENL